MDRDTDLLPLLAWAAVTTMQYLQARAAKRRADEMPARFEAASRLLLARLWQFAERKGVPIFVLPEEEMWHWRRGSPGAAGTHTTIGSFHVIRILDRYRDSPTVLAHELGHHIAITYRGDHTEEGADYEAVRLICLVTTPEERDWLLPTIYAFGASVQSKGRRHDRRGGVIM